MRFLLLCALGAAGCISLDRAVSRNVSVDPALTTDCIKQCEILGLRLSAVVLMLDHGGCVCEPKRLDGADASGVRAGATAAVGLALKAEQRRARHRLEQPVRAGPLPGALAPLQAAP